MLTPELLFPVIDVESGRLKTPWDTDKVAVIEVDPMSGSDMEIPLISVGLYPLTAIDAGADMDGTTLVTVIGTASVS